MATTAFAQPCVASRAWSEIEQYVSLLTTMDLPCELGGGPAVASDSSMNQQAIVFRLRKMLARVRSRQERLLSLPSGSTMEATMNCDFDADLQKWRERTQENDVIRTEIHQKQQQVAEKETEALYLTRQVDDAVKSCSAIEKQLLNNGRPQHSSRISSELEMEETEAQVAGLQRRLDVLRRRAQEKEAMLEQAKAQLQEDMADSPQKGTARACRDLQNELHVAEAQKTIYENEVADCRARLGQACAESAELEQRLLMLRQSREQLENATSMHMAEATVLKQQLIRVRAESARHEEKGRLDAAELARPRTACVASPSSTSLTLATPSLSSRSPPEVSRVPSKRLEANPDLAEQLQAASAHNEWLHTQLEHLSTPATTPCARGHDPPQFSENVASPPEDTPEAPFGQFCGGSITPPLQDMEPELDDTIYALEAQLKALSAQNDALETKARRTNAS